MTAWARMRGVLALAVGLAMSGCAQAGALGDILNPGGTASNDQLVQGDVTFVNANQQYVQVQTTRGQLANIRFDNRTQVVYQQRAYPVTALERGDQVSVRIQQTQQGELYTDQILVTRSIQEIQGTTGQNTSGRQYTRVEGYVGAVDTQRGMFQLRAQNGGMIWVSLPYNASRTTVDRFQRLRANDFVRIGGYPISSDRFELDGFF